MGTIFALHGNFRFYDLRNTFQHLYWIFCLFYKQNQAARSNLQWIHLIFYNIFKHDISRKFSFFRPYEHFPTSFNTYFACLEKKQIASVAILLVNDFPVHKNRTLFQWVRFSEEACTYFFLYTFAKLLHATPAPHDNSRRSRQPRKLLSLPRRAPFLQRQ